ncbi:MAG: hydroxylamine oxidase [Desulfobacterales bacterium]|nr:MAG: hydroxylamine oxidase [Desulfobacterales bacterium]
MGNKALNFWLGIFVLGTATVTAAANPVSEATAECLDCHASIHPGIVQGWQKSRHAQIAPKTAAAVKGLARKVSSLTVPANLQNIVVGCAECHTLRPQAHVDTFEHNGYEVHVVVSPDDCRTCHVQEAEQFSQNLMSHAHRNLAGNRVYQELQRSIIGRVQRQAGRIILGLSDAAAEAEACYYCHGTRLKVIGSEIRDTETAGELEFPIIAGWPNQGVGRINLDGSRGACSACHTRHTFAIEMARKPYTCGECHIGPDVPAFKVYSASKHGNIFEALHQSWDFNAVPWAIGRDFTAPTCAACHLSLLVNSEGELVSARTHQMNNRLPWRIFGLIYAHPHPQNPDTTIIRNKDGLPLPSDWGGEYAAEYLIDERTREHRRKTMQAACLNCHAASWVKAHWGRLEKTIVETNAQTLTATDILGEIWQNGYAEGLAQGGNPFDEAVERKWNDVWQFYANTTRFASAMGGGGDYGVYADGRYHLSQAVLELQDWLELRKRLFPPGAAAPAPKKP